MGKNFRKAALWTAQHYRGEAFSEHIPAVAVMHNARFYPEGWAHDCRVYAASTAKGCKVFDFEPNLCDDTSLPCTPNAEHVHVCLREGGSLPRYGRVVTVAQFYGQFYFHFTAENLPRLLLLLPEILADEDAKVHITDQKPSFVQEALKIFGVPLTRVIDGHGCARVLFIPEPAGCGAPSLGLLHLTRRHVRKVLGCPVPSKKRGLYVVLQIRRGARAILNQKQLAEELEKKLKDRGVRACSLPCTCACACRKTLYVST